MFRSILTYLIAALFEIGGVYLLWKYFKTDKNIFYLVGGAIILIVYGIIGTHQAFSFGKSYAIYGGVFIIMALVWSYLLDNYIPSVNEFIGVLVIITGILIMLLEPVTDIK